MSSDSDAEAPSEPKPKAAGDKNNKRLSVERIYQKKSQLEHILLRPDSYIGSVETVTEKQWVYEDTTESMVQVRAVCFYLLSMVQVRAVNAVNLLFTLIFLLNSER